MYTSVLYFTTLVYMQWQHHNPFTLWNWDDQHKMSRVTHKLEKHNNYLLIRSMCRQIRIDLFNSPVSLLKYKKYLKEVDAEFETLAKDIEIRFNSILKLLNQILNKYEIIQKFYCTLVTLSKECHNIQ